MYTSKVVHKNLVENNAYISAGDPYKGGFAEKNPWWDDVNKINFKAIKCQRSPENAERGNFHRKIYTPLECSEVKKYRSGTADDRLRKGFGFGSRDPSRRDEFANALRAEQYKVAIRRENYFSPLPYLPTSPSQR